jgi:hypothetical protein
MSLRGLTWKCHICGEERPDDKISVYSTTQEIPGTHGGTMTFNVRYCNDKPSCAEAAPHFSFFKKRPKPNDEKASKSDSRQIRQALQSNPVRTRSVSQSVSQK